MLAVKRTRVNLVWTHQIIQNYEIKERKDWHYVAAADSIRLMVAQVEDKQETEHRLRQCLSRIVVDHVDYLWALLSLSKACSQ